MTPIDDRDAREKQLREAVESDLGVHGRARLFESSEGTLAPISIADAEAAYADAGRDQAAAPAPAPVAEGSSRTESAPTSTSTRSFGGSTTHAGRASSVAYKSASSS